MDRIILFDGASADTLRPLTLVRAVADCRVGITTIHQKWGDFTNKGINILPNDSLLRMFPQDLTSGDNCYIDGSCLPSTALWEAISTLALHQALRKDDQIIAYRSNKVFHQTSDLKTEAQNAIYETFSEECDSIRYPEDILRLQEKYLRSDYQLITSGRITTSVDSSTFLRGEDIFIEPSARIYNAILNATDGPIYVGPDVEIMEGAVIKGPVAIGKGTKIHVGAKVYSNTVFGPECRIGGEVKRTCFIGYANKGHEGFLGDSVIGSWCNFGADTNCSNMKNTYGEVSLWDMGKKEFRPTGRQFCGLIMGDHSMCAINTAFTTGSVTGVFANIFGANPPRYAPSFSWGVNGEKYQFEKAIEVAERSMSRRNISLTSAYKALLKQLYDTN
jgi:UDP-N-acetylglucosamine diphosphorylase/glucosamine-1-phosphate N-acetyltransferase